MNIFLKVYPEIQVMRITLLLHTLVGYVTCKKSKSVEYIQTLEKISF
jgi:hypothetical protein